MSLSTYGFKLLRKSRVLKFNGHPYIQKRDIWPLVGAGVAIYAAGTIAQYVLRALKRMESDRNIDDNSGSAHAQRSQTETTKPNNKNDQMYENKSWDTQNDGFKKKPNFYSKRVIGIDAGSTNSKICISSENSAEVCVNAEGSRSYSNAVQVVDAGSIIVGRLAYISRWTKFNMTILAAPILVGEDTNASDVEILKLLKTDVHVAQSPNNNSSTFTINDTGLTMGDANRYVIDHLMSIAMTKSVPCVLSVPNIFDQPRANYVLQQYRACGFNCVASVSDAIAAVIGAKELELIDPTNNEQILVVDIGGRLTQHSIVSWSNDRSPTIVDTNCSVTTGGEFFTDALVASLNSDYARSTGIDLMADKMSKQRLYDACEAAKIELSTSVSSRLYVPYITADKYGPKHFGVTLSRTELLKILEPQFAVIAKGIHGLISSSRINSGSIIPTTALLVGNSARMPIVRESIANVLRGISPDMKLVVPQQSEETVVVGAACALKPKYNI